MLDRLGTDRHAALWKQLCDGSRESWPIIGMSAGSGSQKYKC